ncbi:MAG: PIN domain-containing protein [Hyphomonadaceae bacterium]|nr:PIN domain-containing protein [Hyphomonadaceae bacterium]
MILIDANLLLYAHLLKAEEHARARAWLDWQLNEPVRVGLPWSCLLAFIRISTNPRLHAIPETTEGACSLVETWLARENVWVPDPGPRHAEILLSLLRATRARGNLTSDAHIAALSIEHGLTICSADTDFARFPNVRWMNPLLA